MPLDPQARAYLDTIIALGGSPPREMTVTEWRAMGPERKAYFAIPPRPVASVEDRTVSTADGDVPVRVYRPEATGPLPVFVYYHGGGWVIGSVDQSDNLCRALANLTPCIVVSVEYRLAPETRFPGGLEDCYAATQWAAEHAAELGGDASRLAVGGDSAGGNLAAAVALAARDRGGPSIAYQLLIYPVSDSDFETASFKEMAEGYGLTRDTMMYFWDLYVASEGDLVNPLAAVLRADLASLPPALVITAEYDPLRDEGDALAAKLKAAGVQVEHVSYPGQIHGFFQVDTMMETGNVAVEAAARSMGAALAQKAVTA